MRLVWLVFCLGLATAITCTNSSYAEYYFQWCLSDTECQDNLHLFEDDLWSFTETLDNELLDPMGMYGGGMCDPAVEPWWQALLRTVNLCYPNHYRDNHGQCVLRPGRLEDPDVDSPTGLSGLSSPFMLAAVLAVFIWFAVKVLNAWNGIYKILKAQQRDPENYNAASSATKPTTPASTPTTTPQDPSFKFSMVG